VEQQQSYKSPAQPAADTRHYLVAQATGVFMARFELASDAAFERLAAMAADEDRDVVDVAQEIVKQLGQ
jgi:AmiR/NasT family two-component response regulator